MKKLYIVVRSDISPGLQFAQGAHALAAFQQKFPERFHAWVTGSNNIVCLQALGEEHLHELLKKNEGESVGFHEPDLNDELTAIAVSDQGKHLSSLPLALRSAA